MSAGAVTDEQLIAMLVDRARGDGLQLTGEGGLLQQLTKRVLEVSELHVVQDLLGHADPRTTRRYANSREMHQMGENPMVAC